MTSEERRQSRNNGLAFVVKAQLLTGEEVSRALTRVAHEIVERNHAVQDLTVLGLQTGGEAFARRVVELLTEIADVSPGLGLFDVSFYRDELSLRPIPRTSVTLLDHDLADRHVILVDDVLFTGRTIRAALNALSDWGRPQSVHEICRKVVFATLS